MVGVYANLGAFVTDGSRADLEPQAHSGYAPGN
jgi:hypothetical protein